MIIATYGDLREDIKTARQIELKSIGLKNIFKAFRQDRYKNEERN